MVGTKGQIVIPQQLRRELDIKTKTRLAIYKKGDKLVVTKIKFSPLGKQLETLFREIDAQYEGKRRPTEREILGEIQAHRKEKKRLK